MMANKGILQSEMFYIEHLSIYNHRTDISDFYIEAPEGQGLSNYIKEFAKEDEATLDMRTYIVKDNETDECVGYFSLKAGLISLNENEVELNDLKPGEKKIIREFDTFPGVELANFAVNSTYINKYPYQKGVGYVIFKKFILPMIYEAGKYIGIKMVYIFALPYDRLISRYQRYGFRRLPETEENDLHRRLKPRYDESCRFMYLLLT